MSAAKPAIDERDEMSVLGHRRPRPRSVAVLFLRPHLEELRPAVGGWELSMSSGEVVIVGAGVAGLSLAIMLAERNIDCQVLESRQRFDGPTSGVRISGEGVKILRSMNVDSIGEDAGRVDLRFGGLSASFSARRRDVPAVVVTRLALHEQLMKRARGLGIRVLTGFKVTSVTESADGIEITSEAHEKVTGSLLVGADGVGSTLRHILNPEQSSTKAYAGYLGVGLLTKDETKTEMTLHSYPGHQVGIASCGKVSEAATKLYARSSEVERNCRAAARAGRASCGRFPPRKQRQRRAAI